MLKNEHEVHNCDERSARKNASEVHNFMRKEQRNSGRRWLLKYASIASEHRNFSPTRKRTQKKGLFEFPRKVLLIYGGEEVYTKIATRLTDGYFAYTRVSVFLRLLLIPVG